VDDNPDFADIAADEGQHYIGDLRHGVYPRGAYDCLRAFGLPDHAGGRRGPIARSDSEPICLRFDSEYIGLRFGSGHYAGRKPVTRSAAAP
jgi:hypothetical protein